MGRMPHTSRSGRCYWLIANTQRLFFFCVSQRLYFPALTFYETFLLTHHTKNMNQAQQQVLHQDFEQEQIFPENTNLPQEQEITVKTPRSLQKDYRFVEQIGKGAQGKIFRAIRLKDHQIVAVKQLRIDSIKNWKEYDLFHREADVLASLNIRGVARFYDAIDCFEDDPPSSYIVQEYIPGVSLQQMLNDGHRFTVNDVYDILIQTLQILEKLHHHNPPVIHRDIKPSNLMISPDKNNRFSVTLIDFGAVANPQVQSGGSTVAGTYGYMPPEQLTGKPVPASDVYAVAVLAVQLFSGKNPADIPTKDFRLIFEPYMQDKPHELVTTLRKMLEPRVEKRFADIPVILKEFNNYKRNIFKTDDRKKQPAVVNDDLNYSDKIKKLNYIGENGCIDLWQQLPDDEREIPGVYMEIFRKEYYHIESETRFGANISVVNITYALVMTVLFLILCLAFSREKTACIVFGVFAFISFFAGIVMLALKYGNVERNEPNSEQKYVNKEYENVFIKEQALKSVLKSGRKGMATITGIEYLSVEKDYVTSKYQRKLEREFYKVNIDPRFKILYKFNPPDDKREEDIIHSFVTHIEPENHYKIGDPLPILYLIQDKYFTDIVYSIPYPTPTVDFLNLRSLSDLIAQSESYKMVQYVSDFSGCGKETSFIKDINNSKTNQEVIKVIKGLNCIDFLDHDRARLNVLSTLAVFLSNPTYYPCHEVCVEKLTELALPAIHSSTSRSGSQYTQIVIEYFMDYMEKKPHSEYFPSEEVMKKIFIFLYRQQAYSSKCEKIPGKFWLTMLDLFTDSNVSPNVRALIAERIPNIAPESIFRKLFYILPDYDFPNKEAIIKEAEKHYINLGRV